MHAPPFSALARVYDAIMSDIEHDDWAEFVLAYLQSEGRPAPARMLDLACGTGLSTQPFAARGIAVTGLDGSAEMLREAAQRLPDARLVQGDLRDFGLGERFELVTCLFDSLNNLTDAGDLLAAFRRVRAHLLPGGVFAFDVNTPHGVRELWDGDLMEGVAELPGGGEVHYRWQHEYDAERELGVVQAYCRVGEDVFVETHHERGYGPDTLLPLLQEAGFAHAEACEYPDFAPPDADAPRVWVFAHAGAGPQGEGA